MKQKILSLVILLGLYACEAQPEPIHYGTDLCYNCKMTLMDEKFGCELVTQKGKVFKFDDLICMRRFLHSGTVATKDIKQLVVVNYEKKGDWLAVEKAYFLVATHIQSPMGSNTSAFSTREAALRNNTGGAGVLKSWGELEKTPF